MENTLYFIRHAETEANPIKPISKWKLSRRGLKKAVKLKNKTELQGLDLIITSLEKKAIGTAMPLSLKLIVNVISYKDLNELNRDRTRFLTREEYERAVKQTLENLDESYGDIYGNWETGNHALKRFKKKIDEIDKKYNSKKIGIFGHCYTINLYFADLLGQLNRVYDRHLTNDYCDFGIVKNSQVLKDIAKE